MKERRSIVLSVAGNLFKAVQLVYCIGGRCDDATMIHWCYDNVTLMLFQFKSVQLVYCIDQRCNDATMIML